MKTKRVFTEMDATHGTRKRIDIAVGVETVYIEIEQKGEVYSREINIDMTKDEFKSFIQKLQELQ